MAAFHIHQDSENENASHAFPEKSKNVQGAKKKRTAFAVLNSVPQNIRGVPGKTAFRDDKTNKRKNTSETYGNLKIQQQKKALTTVPVEQFKTFSVYEDISPEDSTKNRQNAEERRDSAACPNFSHPWHVLPETPMSVDDAMLPMSIDKSPNNDENKYIAASPCPPRNDREERFFEVKEYQQDILEYFKQIEKKFRPKATYMTRQQDINFSMRMILVDWLVDVAGEYGLHNETLYLAVSYVDRFLSIMSVVRAKLQLVGAAAMLVASKKEEIYPPEVDEFALITDNTYTKAEVLKMEQLILRALHFDLCVPTNLEFINTYAVLCEIPGQVKFLATYIAELSLLFGDPYLHFLSSQISAAALALARLILDFPIWCLELEKTTTYSLHNLKTIILHLCRTHNSSPTLAQQAIPQKYKANEYMEVSTIRPIQLSEEQFEQIARTYDKSEQL